MFGQPFFRYAKQCAVLLWLSVLCLQMLCAQQFVSENEARTVAVNFMAQRYGTIQYAQDKILKINTLEKNGYVLMYEVFFQNNNSVLLSGVKSCKAILGFRFQTGGVSVLNAEGENADVGLQDFVERYQSQILYAIGEAENKDAISSEWKQLSDTAHLNRNLNVDGGVFGPMLSSAWGQTRAFPKVCDGYNYYVTETTDKCRCASVNKCPTGCVATAMGQIIRYWQYPAKSTVTGENYQWNYMTDTLIAASASYEQERKAIARLLRDCGEAADMHYCYASKMYGCQSFTWPVKARDALVEHFNYSDKAHRELRSSYSTKTWKTMLIDDIRCGCPVLYASASLAVGDYAECGHAYVCDGYDVNADMFHFNWGYDGEGNGWYTIDDLIMSLSKSKYNWNHFERAVFNIYPADYEPVLPSESGKVAVNQ